MDKKSLTTSSFHIKLALIILIILLFFVVSVQVAHAAEWQSGNYRWANGTRLMMYRGYISGEYFNWAATSVSNWNSALKQGSSNVQFVIAASPYASKGVIYYEGNYGKNGWVGLATGISLKAQGIYIVDGYFQIQLNTYAPYNPNITAKRCATAHEMGHTLWLGDVNTVSSGNDRLMWWTTTSNTAPTLSDICVLKTRY